MEKAYQLDAERRFQLACEQGFEDPEPREIGQQQWDDKGEKHWGLQIKALKINNKDLCLYVSAKQNINIFSQNLSLPLQYKNDRGNKRRTQVVVN